MLTFCMMAYNVTGAIGECLCLVQLGRLFNASFDVMTTLNENIHFEYVSEYVRKVKDRMKRTLLSSDNLEINR